VLLVGFGGSDELTIRQELFRLAKGLNSRELETMEYKRKLESDRKAALAKLVAYDQEIGL
jgi:hypothetical protein